MTNSDNLEKVILRYLSKEATPEEIKYIKVWLKESDNRKIFTQKKSVWDATNPSFYPDSISLDKAYKNIRPEIKANKHKIRSKKSFIHYWQQVSAILILPLLLGGIYLLLVKNNSISQIQEITSYQEIFSPYGTRSIVYLPDSSKVWLNAGGYLKYPLHFRNNNRKVYLIGEAYFKVKSDKKNPFIVETSNMSIKATGTEFNVEAFKKDTIAAVTLTNGIVDIALLNNKKTKLQLSPNERISYNKESSSYEIRQTDPYKWYSWKDGVLAFRNDPLEYVFKRLGYMYNIDFIIKDKEISQYVYRATFEGESLDQILKLLEISAPISYRRVGIRKDSDNFYQRQRIEVFKTKQ